MGTHVKLIMQTMKSCGETIKLKVEHTITLILYEMLHIQDDHLEILMSSDAGLERLKAYACFLEEDNRWMFVISECPAVIADTAGNTLKQGKRINISILE